jgi:hypothetical protein
MQASKQFLTARTEILSAFDIAREKAKLHEVQTYHGCYVEEKIRLWLETFLPKRYAVCAGYVVTQGTESNEKLPHFDVIIYDALNSPILWIEDLSNNSSQSRAIPVEYVLSVFEVKSSLNTKTIQDAIEHINDLYPLAEKNDAADERYKKYLPNSFFWGMIYIEARNDANKSAKTIYEKYLTKMKVRGHYSTLIMRGEGKDCSGKIMLTRGESKIESNADLFEFGMYTLPNEIPGIGYLGAFCMWSDIMFVNFAFDILALLNGTYELGRLSSFHGLSFPKLPN